MSKGISKERLHKAVESWDKIRRKVMGVDEGK